MPDIAVPHTGPLATLVGTETRFTRTLGEYDVYAFGGITGDTHPNHMDEEYCKRMGMGGRIAQGALMVGFIAGAVSKYLMEIERPGMSYGYDRVRFTKPVHIGDTLTVVYRIARVDEAARKAWAEATLTNQRGETVCVGTHVIYFQA